ncbi:MAG: helix-turn-helix domain-containing protein [Myxococcota bacterium]
MVRWSLVVVTPERTFPAELPPGKTTVVGRGALATLQLPDASVSERHVSLAARDEGLLLEVLRGAGEVLLNDVPSSGQALLQPGDEVRLGGSRLIAVATPALPTARPRVASHDEVMSRLEEELLRAGVARPVGVLLVSAPALNVAARQALTRRVVEEVAKAGIIATWGEVAGDLLLAVLPEASERLLSDVTTRLPAVAGPRAKVVTATAPVDGFDAETLVGVAWARLLEAGAEPVEPTFVDPVMVRLAGLMESDAVVQSGGPVCVVGPRGAGRRTLLGLLTRAADAEVREISAADGPALEAALKEGAPAPGRRQRPAPPAEVKGSGPAPWLLVREVDSLPEAAVAELLKRSRTRVLATGRTAPARGLFQTVVEVPPLHARPQDILALADNFVSRARRLLGRPRLTLGAEARSLLGAWRWPGNVRELENALLRAARLSVRDEVGRDSLPARLSADAPADDYRGALKAAEREVLLEALARTRWNVTAAATRLGMPRRTVVYRMAKLGLKRPSR